MRHFTIVGRTLGVSLLNLINYQLNDVSVRCGVRLVRRRSMQFNPGVAALFFCHHLISLFARASTSGGIVTPICLAVFRLITSSNLVGCSTGRSAGLAPFRILST